MINQKQPINLNDNNMTIENFKKIQLIQNAKNPVRGTSFKVDKVNGGYIERQVFRGKVSGNYGVLTGDRNDITVVDLDFPKLTKAEKVHNSWIKEFGEEPGFDTLTVRTRSGGRHYYFKYDEAIKQTQSDEHHVDIRSNGGYVVGPGSSIDGKFYKTIKDVPIAPMPMEVREWLLTNLYTEAPKKTRKTTDHNTTPDIVIQRDTITNKYSFTDDLCRLIFDDLPDQYWTKYQGRFGQPSFLVWTTACRILDKFELWDEYNKKKPNKKVAQKKYNYENNLKMWNAVDTSLDCVTSLLLHCREHGERILSYHKYQPVLSSVMTPDFEFERPKLGYNFFPECSKVGAYQEAPTFETNLEKIFARKLHLKKIYEDGYEDDKVWLYKKDHGHLFGHWRKLIREEPKITFEKSFFVRSGTGTGKTTSFFHYAKDHDIKFISLGSRITLVDKQYEDASKLGMECEHYGDMDYRIGKVKKSFVCQIDSLAKILPCIEKSDVSDVVVYLDEYNSLIRYLCGSSTMDDKRVMVYDAFIKLLKYCKQVICTDADITDTSMMLMQKNNIAKKLNTIKTNTNTTKVWRLEKSPITMTWWLAWRLLRSGCVLQTPTRMP
eukprot:SAG11_NODE_1807_length_4228_cov_3.662146_4_plen_605_part_00